MTDTSLTGFVPLMRWVCRLVSVYYQVVFLEMR